MKSSCISLRHQLRCISPALCGGSDTSGRVVGQGNKGNKRRRVHARTIDDSKQARVELLSRNVFERISKSTSVSWVQNAENRKEKKQSEDGNNEEENCTGSTDFLDISGLIKTLNTTDVVEVMVYAARLCESADVMFQVAMVLTDSGMGLEEERIFSAAICLQLLEKACHEERIVTPVVMFVLQIFSRNNMHGGKYEGAWKNVWARLGSIASPELLLTAMMDVFQHQPLPEIAIQSIVKSLEVRSMTSESAVRYFKKLQMTRKQSLYPVGYSFWAFAALEVGSPDELKSVLAQINSYILDRENVIECLGMILGRFLGRTEATLGQAMDEEQSLDILLEQLENVTPEDMAKAVLQAMGNGKKPSPGAFSLFCAVRKHGLLGNVNLNENDVKGYMAYKIPSASSAPPFLPPLEVQPFHRVRWEQAKDPPLTMLYERVMSILQKSKKTRLMDILFDFAISDGVKLSRGLLNKASSLLETPEQAYNFYCHAIAMNWDISYSYRSIILNLIKGSQGRQWWDTALKILHRMHMELFSFTETNIHTSIVVSCGRHGWESELVELYNLMLQDGIEPNMITWNAFISASHRVGKPHLGFEFAQAMASFRVEPDVSTYSSLLACCAALKNGSKAVETWDDMLKHGIRPDQVACSSYMWACLEGNKPEVVVEVFQQWREDGTPPGWRQLKPNELKYFSQVTSLYAAEGKWALHRKSLRLQKWIRGRGFDPERLELKELSDLAKDNKGPWIQALRLADPFLPVDESSVKPTAAAFSFAILAHVQLGNLNIARGLAEELPMLEFSHSTVEYATALGACASVKALHPALEILELSKRNGVTLSPQAFTSAITVCGEAGDVDAALRVLRDMISSGIRPNQHTVNSVLSLCASTNRIAGALKLFHSMEPSFNIQPDVICFATMWSILGKHGRWADALEFYLVAESMYEETTWPYAPLVGMGKSLNLQACDGTYHSIDLHNLSTIGGSIVLRGWLLLLREFFESNLLGEHATLYVITGHGKNSPRGQPKLKPAISELLTSGFGKELPFHIRSSNTGQICINIADVVSWFKSGNVDLGLGGPAREEHIVQILTGHTVADLKLIKRITH